MRLLGALFLAILALSCQAQKDYTGYKVFRVWAHVPAQLEELNKLRHNPNFDFWSKGYAVDEPIDIMVEPTWEGFFNQFLDENRFTHEILIEDVQSTLPPLADPRVAPRTDGKISFDRFERYDTVVAYLEALARKYPDIVSLFTFGKTSEGRNLLGIKVASGGKKPAIFVDGGIHAREWAAPAFVLYFIDQLLENPSNRHFYEIVDWYIVPVLNPDGYEWSHTKDRLWRKTRSWNGVCPGVDANRNYGFHWMEVGASNWQCDITYGGPKAFSEPETDGMRKFVESVPRDTIKLYLTFHAYGQYLLYPWGFTSSYPPNRQELHTLAQNMDNAIASIRGTRYKIGSSTNLLYPAAGGSDDWMMGVAGVPITYTVELPEGGSQGFNPPPSSIVPVGRETFEGVKVAANYIYHRYSNEV